MWFPEDMAGGMSSGRGRTLAERSGAGSREPASDDPRTVAVSAGAGARIGLRHVWVHDPASPARRWPGVLTGWRRDAEGGWVALVAYAVRDADGTVLITAWLKAEQLSPAGPG